MLTNDPTYIKAKKVKEGIEKLTPEYSHLNDFLIKEYSAHLLNADIYYEPIVKSFGPRLRLIIDKEIDETKLPIYYLDRQIIGERFIKIYNKLNPETPKNFSAKELNVDYIIYDKMLFEETQLTVLDREILSSLKEPTIQRLISLGSEYIFLFENTEIMQQKKAELYDQTILKTLIQLIKKKGYKGKYTSKIHITFDIVESFNKPGSVYNYLR
ncbi:hypothetical protein ACJRPK_13385 [Aquimarina sp. 2-A2]|uniref:hypothetical protein n=1 Tax=Aquimarina sp. 2-A2 TaxID=3382644 RepID=UPI00387F3533